MPAGPYFDRRRGLRDERQIELNPGLCTRGVRVGVEIVHFGRYEFSLFHSLLRNRPQDAIGQIAQLLPIGRVLMLHLTLHYY